MFTDKSKEVRPAVSFVKDDSWKKKVIHKIEDDINGVTRFAITKLTAGGSWLRGNLLFYCLNDVQVYTDPDNIIFVDTVNKTMFIREHEKVANQISPEDPERKQYIMLYTDLGYDEENLGSEEFPLRWESVTGRTTAYENIKVNAPVIDIDRSIVLAESVAIKDALSVRQFMEYLKNSNIINDESFDINDYAGTEYF